MHERLELILPSWVQDFDKAIKEVMDPFQERHEDEEGGTGFSDRHSFWDWWVVGGRWAGIKPLEGLDKKKVDEFWDWLGDAKITISGLQWGKPTLDPPEQKSVVEAEWHKRFPGWRLQHCPIFDYSNPNRDSLPDDIMRLKDVHEDLLCSRVILAGPEHVFEKGWPVGGKLGAQYMVSDTLYNGVNWEPGLWNKTLKHALALAKLYAKNINPEFAETFLPIPESWVVTVDYHW